MKKIVLLAPALVFIFGCVPQTEMANSNSNVINAQTTNTNTSITATTVEPFQFETPSKTPHYESNAPAHEAVLPAAPYTVVMDFNFDVVAGSTIAIMHDGTDYGVGEATIDDNKLGLRRRMQAAAPDGLYSVEYSACWPDGICY